MSRAPMSPQFAVFNLHVNKAGVKANKAFKEHFGVEMFKKHIAPLHKAGIMTIFDKSPNRYTKWWVIRVTGFVNGQTPGEVQREYFKQKKAA